MGRIMENSENMVHEGNTPSLFIDGYFDQLIQAGKRPSYGYPTNHLPETTIDEMDVVTGFMVATKSKK